MAVFSGIIQIIQIGRKRRRGGPGAALFVCSLSMDSAGFGPPARALLFRVPGLPLMEDHGPPAVDAEGSRFVYDYGLQVAPSLLLETRSSGK